MKLQPLLNKGLLGDDCSAILRAHPKAKKFAARPKRLDVVEELFFRHRAVRDAEESAAQTLKPTPTEKFVLPTSPEEDFFTSIPCLLSKEASFVKPKEFDDFTKAWGLTWILSPNDVLPEFN